MIIKLDNITYGYDNQAVVDAVTMEINHGDFIGMIGPNGGGKSTIIKLMMGLLKPWKGQLLLGKGRNEDQVRIGYLPQYHDFDKKFPINVLEVVLSGLAGKTGRLYRYTKDQKHKAKELLSLLGLENIEQQAIGELSGGQMQRAFLGRALVADPDLLILDEPVTYVDNKFEQELYQLLEFINDQTAILLVSHDVGQIVSIVKTIACVNHELHYHPSNKIDEQILASYNCPIELITHGKVPHRVLHNHE